MPSDQVDRLLFLDNFDSFTWNLVQAFEVLGSKIRVVRPHAFSRQAPPTQLVIGPGPGRPEAIPLTLHDIADVPTLGVCLGHQWLALAYGGQVVQGTPVHGKTSAIFHAGTGLFAGLPQGLLATRYHSLIVDRPSLPSCLKITAETADGTIMGLQHRSEPYHSVQFHPESVLTTKGPQLLANFLSLTNVSTFVNVPV